MKRNFRSCIQIWVSLKIKTQVHFEPVLHCVTSSCWILSASAFQWAAISTVLISVYKRARLTLIWVGCGSPGEQGPAPSHPARSMEIKWEITSSNTTKYHTTTHSNLKARGTHHILSQESSPTATPTQTHHRPTTPPPHHPHSIASWQEWQHCRWTNRFQLRSHLGCLIWDKSRCASPKAPQANSASYVHEYHDWSCWKFSWAMSDSLWAHTGWIIIIIVNNDNDNKLLLSS